MNTSIEEILEKKEQIVWKGVIDRRVLLFNLIFAIVIVGLISGFLFSQDVISYTSKGNLKTINGSTIGIIIFVVGLFFIFLNYFLNIVKKYAITKKRIIIKSGIIGTDFNSIYYNEIKSVNVNIGVIGKMFKVGTIRIDTGKIGTSSGGSGGRVGRSYTVYDELKHIKDPYQVYKYFQSSTNERLESLYSGRADKENPKTI
jgi:uncharacterized membrane protein YdbT with pleckstrin-like domain